MSLNDADPAIVIAREWYSEMDLVVDGVDFGKCCVYDCLQIVNRSILRQRELESRQDENLSDDDEKHKEE